MFIFIIVYSTNTFEDNHIFLFRCLYHNIKNNSKKITNSISFNKYNTCMRVQEHLSGKSAAHEHISSCKDCHSCSISNFYTLAQANTDFEAKIKDLYIYKYTPKLNNQIYHCCSSSLLNIFLSCIVLIK